MHELSIAYEIVEIAVHSALENKAEHITDMELDIGSASGVVPEALEMALQSAVKGTILEHAVIRFNIIRAEARCNHCQTLFEPEDLVSFVHDARHLILRLPKEWK
ncbi:MAG: hydrogenase maturation nickel metallochaperone HypA [Bacteroidales bacterium]|nr:hydrogenase maturation nickel metallochaperone HypA [Bacteroidales bacterium]